MPTWAWIVIVVAAVVIVGAIVWSATRARRRRDLQERFGSEYDRTVADAPSRREAESELSEREKRRDELDIRPLDQSSRDRYASQWQNTQAAFVDDPETAVGDADRLIQQVMRERGYPVDDFEQRANDLSVDHPEVISNYRAAHGISVANERGKASTEDLRTAMVHYRALFSELLETGSEETTRSEPAETARS
jgi:FtsZ-interacting cell division protein ZipA